MQLQDASVRSYRVIDLTDAFWILNDGLRKPLANENHIGNVRWRTELKRFCNMGRPATPVPLMRIPIASQLIDTLRVLVDDNQLLKTSGLYNGMQGISSIRIFHPKPNCIARRVTVRKQLLGLGAGRNFRDCRCRWIGGGSQIRL